MEEEWVVNHCQLRQVWLDHPEWSRQKMADEIGCSKSWVKKWLGRIRSVPLEDQQVRYGWSRIPKHPPPRFSPEVINKILEIRDHPPRLLGRTPGPLTILYYLYQDQALKESGEKLPRSTRTVWKILTQYQRIYHPVQSIPEPEERPAPGVLQEAGLPDLLRCWEPYTKIDIQEYLDRWINHNAQVSLVVEKAETLAKSGQYETEVTIHVDSDQDYEILTSLEYKTEKDGQGNMLPLRFVKKGIQTVRFVSDKAPLYVKLDPDCRVTRMTDDRLTWEKGT